VFVKKGDVESKMLSALLTGVNRAYPYAKGLLALAMLFHCCYDFIWYFMWETLVSVCL